jgi:hypothetical protein
MCSFIAFSFSLAEMLGQQVVKDSQTLRGGFRTD